MTVKAIDLMRGRTLILAAAAVLTLSACGGSEDPSKAGLIDGIGNLASGKYEQRQGRLKKNLKDARSDRERWRDQAARMQEENRRLAAEERRLEGQLAAMNSRIARDRRRVARAQQAGTVSPAKAARIQTELQKLQTRLLRIRASKASNARKRAMAKSVQTEHEALISRTRNFTDLN